MRSRQYFRWLFCLGLLLAIQPLFGQPAGYYDPAQGKQGEALKQALHEIIDDHSVLSYSQLWTAFYTTDDRPNGTVWDVYSDNPDGSNPYDYNFGSPDQCGNYSGEGSCYNREHSFPKSWFSSASPMYTDLFHLYPTDGYVNGRRSNYPFGETQSATWTSLNGSKVGPCSVNGYSGTIFEPIDAYKGDFARTYFYMATRYFGEDDGWPGSPMVDGAEPEPWAREMLFRWHANDPVSQKELDRNNAIYQLQGNRNPFIDHPEYVSWIYGGAALDELAPDVDSIITVSQSMIQVWFNEPLDLASATDVTHYSISGGVGVDQASLTGEDQSVVELMVNSLDNGSYALTLNGVSDTAGNALVLAIFPFSVNITSIDLWSKDGFLFYPNPSNGVIHASALYRSAPVDQVQVLDLSGKTVIVGVSRQEGEYIIQLNDLPSGIYTIRFLFRDGRRFSRKLILQ